MSKRNKQKNDDPGISFTNMDVPGMPWHDRKGKTKDRERAEQLSKKERKAVMWAGLLRVLPTILIMIFSFSLAILLVYFWLS